MYLLIDWYSVHMGADREREHLSLFIAWRLSMAAAQLKTKSKRICIYIKEMVDFFKLLYLNLPSRMFHYLYLFDRRTQIVSTTMAYIDVHLLICVADCRFTTPFFFFFFFFPQLRMWTAAAWLIFTTPFTVLHTGRRPSVCSKCIFYVVMECICIIGLVWSTCEHSRRDQRSAR